jgi:hypothetical protein
VLQLREDFADERENHENSVYQPKLFSPTFNPRPANGLRSLSAWLAHRTPGSFACDREPMRKLNVGRLTILAFLGEGDADRT